MIDGNQLIISFEFFPPKTDATREKLVQEVANFVALKPRFFSVTYGAGGSTRDGTIQTVKMLQQATPVQVAPHLSCMGSTREELIEVLNIYRAMDVKRIVALRGDMPSGMGQLGELHFASELVSLIREVSGDFFHIEVAAYPEYHPQARNAQDDVMNLLRKVEAGADSAITQYFFNPDAYVNFLDECARVGIFIPIVPGIMPISSFERLVRFSNVCGAEIPQWIRKRLEYYQDDTEALKSFGLEVVYKLCERLIADGAPGLHFYTLNQPEPTCSLVKRLQEVPHYTIADRFEV